MRIVLACLVLAACGGRTENVDGGGGDSAPPVPVDPCGDGGTCSSVFVMRLAYLGDTPRGSSQTTPTAWKDFGENVDGLVTDRSSTNVCQRAAGAPSSVQNDGNGGIDNSFGQNILPIVQSAGSIPDPSQIFTAWIAAGRGHSLLFRVGGELGRATARLDVGAPLGKPASFDGSDTWPPSLFPSGSPSASLTDLKPSLVPDGSGGYLFSSGRSSTRVLLLLTGLPVPVDRLQFTMRVKPRSLEASSGVLSGVIPTEPFLAMFRLAAGGISKSLCGAAFDGIAQQIRQTQDILSDGTNRSGVSCDAISFGMGFDPALTRLGAPTTEMPIQQTCQ